jgi:hypothetical protein
MKAIAEVMIPTRLSPSDFEVLEQYHTTFRSLPSGGYHAEFVSNVPFTDMEVAMHIESILQMLGVSVSTAEIKVLSTLAT